MKSILKFKLIILALLCLNSCEKDDANRFEFATSLGDAYTIEALDVLEKDLAIDIRSSQRWTLVEKPEWFTAFSPSEYHSMSMKISAKIKQNVNVMAAKGDLVFKLDDGSLVRIPCTQFGTAGFLELTDVDSFDVDYQIQEKSTTFRTNATNIGYRLEPESASAWVSVKFETTNNVDYTCKIKTTTENRGVEKRDVDIYITGEDSSGEVSDKVTLSQMYYVEPITMTCTDDGTSFKLDWTPSTNSSITYYSLDVYDTAETPNLLQSIDVSGVSTFDLTQLNAIKNGTYVGALKLSVGGKSASTETSFLAQSAVISKHTHFESGEGTLAMPYKIGNTRHFNNIMALKDKGSLSKEYLQSADITFPNTVTSYTNFASNITVVGSDTEPFTGVYDGDGKSLNNVVIVSDAKYVAPFAMLGSEAGAAATIEDLTVKVKYIEGRSDVANSDAKGAVVGGIVGFNNGVIKECYVDAFDSDSAIYGNDAATIQAMNKYVGFAGGIAGANEYSITDCANLGCTVVSRVVAGGITGGAINYPNAAGAKGAVERCYNLATVILGNPCESVTGVSLPCGISIPVLTFNHQNIYAAGGVIGRADICYDRSMTIRKCFNSGQVLAEGAAGGVVGYLAFANMAECYNSGKVTGVRNDPAPAVLYPIRHAGGVVGYTNGTNFSLSVLYNVGEVGTASDMAATGNLYKGGIVGTVSGNNVNVKISNVVCSDENTVWGNTPDPATSIEDATCIIASKADLTGTLANYGAAFMAPVWVFAAGYDYAQLADCPHVNP